MEKKNRNPEFWRYAGFLVLLFGIFIWLVSGLINLQLRQSDEYIEKADETKTKTIALRGKRGNISTSDSVIPASLSRRPTSIASISVSDKVSAVWRVRPIASAN